MFLRNTIEGIKADSNHAAKYIEQKLEDRRREKERKAKAKRRAAIVKRITGSF